MDRVHKNWWVLALRGGVGIVFGLMCYMAPRPQMGTLLAIFGTYAIIDGLLCFLELLPGSTRRNRELGRGQAPVGTVTLEALVTIAAGLLAFFYPGPASFVVLMAAFVRSFFVGAAEMFESLWVWQRSRSGWILALVGSVSVAFSMLIPVSGLYNLRLVATVMGTWIIWTSVILFVLAFRLRREEVVMEQALERVAVAR